MKKNINKTTVIIVLAVFLTISVGYALFSDTITIEGTATAQGNFDVEATCYTTLPDELLNVLDEETIAWIESSSGYKDEVCTVVDDKVTYSVGFEYPGASKFYAVKFTNVGSIDAKISEEEIDSQMGNVIIKSYDSENNLVSTKEFIDFFELVHLIFQREDNSIVVGDEVADDDYPYLYDEESGSYLLRTGKNWYWVFRAYWPSGGYQEDGLHYEAKQTIEFPFEQYTK